MANLHPHARTRLELQACPRGSTEPAPPPPASAPLPRLPGTAPRFSRGFAVTPLLSSLLVLLGNPELLRASRAPLRAGPGTRESLLGQQWGTVRR